MKSSRLLLALCVLFPAVAWSDPVHNLWATTPLFVFDPSGAYTPISTSCSFSWNENTRQAFADARATTASGDVYVFQLVAATANTTRSEITGTWNVTKNGVALCTACEGTAYGLDQPVGSYFKLYVGNFTYHLAASITNVYDY